MIPNIGEFVLEYGMTGGQPESIGNRHISRVQGVYACALDEGQPDAWVAISAGSDAEFAALCGVLGRPELAHDPRFADVVSRHHHQDTLDGIIAEWTARRTQDDAARELQDAGVAAAPVLRVPDLMADEHLRARGFWEPVSQAAAGTWEMEGVVWRMHRTPGHVRVPPPMFGEHNDWVLRELLGLDDAEVAALERDEVIARSPHLGVHA